MSDNKVREEIKEMARLAMFTGRITEFHENNLKRYPFVFLNGVKSAQITYDLGYDIIKEDETEASIKRNNYVDYSLIVSESAQDHLAVRFKDFEDSVRALFWKEVNLVVRFNGKQVYPEIKK